MADLFANNESIEKASDERTRPLADRVRPRVLDGFFGQEHLL
ncbi:uncharacterized protein METZ01_LOCUS446626, partial [marine metagenome]